MSITKLLTLNVHYSHSVLGLPGEIPLSNGDDLIVSRNFSLFSKASSFDNGTLNDIRVCIGQNVTVYHYGPES